MTQQAELKRGSTGVVPVGEGWFVLNARDARWHHAPSRSALCEFEGETPFAQLGINLSVLEPGQAMSQYHWEADQEDFLVLTGEALLIIEGEERPLRAWDLVHCPAGVRHVILGAGAGPCIVLAVGARDRADDRVRGIAIVSGGGGRACPTRGTPPKGRWLHGPSVDKRDHADAAPRSIRWTVVLSRE